MKKSGRSNSEISLMKLQIEISSKMEIEENNVLLAASLAYFFVVLYAASTEQVEKYFGIILILTAIMIIWHFRDKRKETKRKYEAQIEALIDSEQS